MAGQGEACRGCATADVLRERIAVLEAELIRAEATIVNASTTLTNVSVTLRSAAAFANHVVDPRKQ